MKKSKLLALGLTLVMGLGLMPADAWAAAAEIVVEPTHVYVEVYNFDAEGTALVRKDWEGKQYEVKVNGSELTETPYTPEGTGEEEDFPLPEGTLQVTYDETTDKYGYADAEGNVVIPCEYDDYYDYFLYPENPRIFLAKTVGENALWGAVDRSNKVVVPFQYSSFWAADWDEKGNELAILSQSQGEGENYTSHYVIYDMTAGAERFSLPSGTYFSYTFAGSPIAVVSSYDEDGNYTSLIDSNGKTLIPDGTYNDIMVASEDRIMVGKRQENGYSTRYALAKTDGTLLTDFIYSSADNLYDGTIRVYDENYMVGVLDKDGKLIVPCKFEFIGEFHNGVAVAEGSDYNYGLIDMEGNTVLPMEYDTIGHWYDWDGVSPYVWVCKVDDDWTSHYGVVKLDYDAPTPAAPAVPSTGTAYERTADLEINGKLVKFQCYYLKDENGNGTTYYKIRDLAHVLNGTSAQFDVGWDGSVTLTTGTAYTSTNGTEMDAPFSGDKTYEPNASATKIDGVVTDIGSFTLKDDANRGYTYYKLRDLGDALGFTVDWDADRAIATVKTN